jgi:hypothetical protein
MSSSEASIVTDGPEYSYEELLAQLEILEAENEELYESYVRAKRTQYRRTAVGLFGIGVGAVVAAVIVQPARTVLLALAGVGLFSGVLTFYLTPEQFVAADTGRDIYAALAGNEAALVSELGLSDQRLYVPTDSVDQPVTLYIPQQETSSPPGSEALINTLVATEDSQHRGVAFEPSGGPLFKSFTQALSGSLGETPSELGTQLADALTAQFELVDAAEGAVESSNGELTVTVTGSAYGPVTRFDHPVVSFIAVGVAQGTERPVSVSVTEADSRADYRIRCRLLAPSSES